MKFPAFEPIELKGELNFGIVDLPIEKISPNKNQPRKNFDHESLEELSFSIKKYGILQPIIVQKLNENEYQIIAGERRWRASSLAGLKRIPVIVKSSEDNKNNIAISLIENIQRKELSPIELADTYYDLHSKHGLKHETIAKMVGKKRETISNFIRLLDLTPYVKNLLISGKIDMGHAKLLITLSSEQQILVVDRIIQNDLSVRETEKYIATVKTNSISNRFVINNFNEKIQDWEKVLSKKLHSKVNIKIDKNGKGRVVFNFESVDEIDWLVKNIMILS